MRAVCVSDLRRLNLLALGSGSTRGDLLGTAERIRTNEAQDVKACVLTMSSLRVFAAKQGNAFGPRAPMPREGDQATI